MEDNMHTWNDDQIREFYDNNPNLGVSTYAGMLGLSVGELKDILMPSPLTEYRNRWSSKLVPWT
jgi:hypothetical protein